MIVAIMMQTVSAHRTLGRDGLVEGRRVHAKGSLRRSSRARGASAHQAVEPRRRDRRARLQRAHAAGVDREIGAHAGAQVRGVLVGGEAEAQRHALHDLDPVAAGVLRRQDRELRAGARRDRADLCPSTPGPGRRRSSRSPAGPRGRRSGPNSFGLPSTHRPLSATTANTGWPAGGDAAEFDLRHLRRDAVDRREHLGVAQVALGVVEPRLRLDVFGETCRSRRRGCRRA